MTAADKINLKIETGEIEYPYEIIVDILTKISGGKLHETCSKFNSLFSPFLLCRYLSMKTSLIGYSEILNQLWYRNGNETLSKEQLYILAYNLIPKQHSGFIQYIKKPEKKNEKNINNSNINGDQSYISTSIDDL